MKKVLTICLLASSLAFGGGFVSSKASNLQNISSVKEALKAKDDEKITLRGYINKALGDEKYEFRDQNGDTIIVEIDDKDWGGLTVNENTFIEIYGEVDKKLNKNNEIDVDRVKLAE